MALASLGAPFPTLHPLLYLLLVMATTTSSSPCTRAYSGHVLSHRFPYTLPVWARDAFQDPPINGRLSLGNFPTPLYRLVPTLQSDRMGSKSLLKRLENHQIRLYIKRDDASHGCELGGNKIRKLEFLLADALARDYRSVVTIGGEQSNHCRATAGAARMLGLEPHLILRQSSNTTKKKMFLDDDEEEDDIGYTGNLLFDRMLGSTIYTCTTGEYGRIGSDQMVARLCRHLEEQDHKDTGGAPYPIPVGGSNGLGTFGYISAVEEMLSQWQEMTTTNNINESTPSTTEKLSLDHVVFACGSGGTAGGIAMGISLAYKDQPIKPTVHAIGVCDSPEYFYNHVSKIADQMGLVVPPDETTESYIRSMFTAYSGKGHGYAQSTPEELAFISDFALETGIVLDPVYSGKAMFHFMTHVLEVNPESFVGKNILFVHTGGALGLFGQVPALLPTMSQLAPTKRLDIYGKDLKNGVDISKSF